MNRELIAETVTVRHGRAEVLSHADFGLGAGEVVGLIGPNGAGKTTLLKAIAGVIAPTLGTVSLQGRALADWPRRAYARRVGYLAQAAVVHWPLTVEHLVTLGRLPHRDPFRGLRPADAAAVSAALAQVDASHLRERVVTTLSGGERARVMLARVLAGEPRFLLADEPGTGLDPAHQLRIMSHLRDLARRGCGVVVVLHDLTLATRFCDRLVMLDGGRVVADGPVGDVLSAGHVRSVFGVRCVTGEYEGEPLLVPWAVA